MDRNHCFKKYEMSHLCKVPDSFALFGRTLKVHSDESKLAIRNPPVPPAEAAGVKIERENPWTMVIQHATKAKVTTVDASKEVTYSKENPRTHFGSYYIVIIRKLRRR